MSDIPEHGREPVPGLPELLPDGEEIVWQGAPSWWALAVRALHVRKVAIWFAFFLAVRVGTRPEAADHLTYAGLAAGGVALLTGLAWLMARSTLYTITTRRVVMRFGISIPISINLPFNRIDSVEMREHRGASADFALGIRPSKTQRLSYLVLWPHARPWRTAPVEPMLRCLADYRAVAARLTTALQTSADTEAVRSGVVPDPARAALIDEARARRRPRQGDRFPLPPLLGAAALLLIALVSVAWFRISADPGAPAPLHAAVASVHLKFEDRSDGAVLVYNARTGRVLDELPAGTNNFLRATMRGLVRGRNALAAADRSAFGLYRIADGQLLLVDPVTGRHVDLWAFGESNAEVFSRLLERAREPITITQATTPVTDIARLPDGAEAD